MIIGKSKRELDKMRASGRLVGLVLQKLREMVKPGITTIEIDREAEKMIRDAGALPTFKGYNGFPYSICASVNEQIVHGFPSKYVLQEGDIFSIDCGVTLEGFVGDTATTVPVGEVDEEQAQADPDHRRVSGACDSAVPSREPPGRHRMGRSAACRGKRVFRRARLRRPRDRAPDARRSADSELWTAGGGAKIKSGYVFAVEPMVNQGSHFTKVLSDGWTVVTVDGKPSAHAEHTIAITEEGPEVLTLVTSDAAG